MLFRVHALADLALKRPLALLAVNGAVCVLCVALSLGAPNDLGIGSTALDDRTTEPLLVAVEGEGEVTVDSRVFTVTRDVIASQLEADPAIAEVEVAETARGRRYAVLVARFADSAESDRAEAVERLDERIDPGPLRVLIGGETATLAEARRVLGDDLWRLELLVLPLVALLAAAAVGPRLAIAPLLAMLTALAGTVATMRLAGLAFDLSLLGAAPALAIAAVLGIEFSALIARTHRDESLIESGAETLERTVVGAARTLAQACAAASVPALGLLATPLDQAPSLALGCALAAVLAALSALVATPAAIVLWGPRGPRRESEPGRVATVLRSIPARLARGPWRVAIGAGIALAVGLAIAYPALDATSRPFAPADLPGASDAARAAELAGDAVQVAGGSIFGEDRKSVV